jgi:RluA family pseudouridine synthase
MTDVHSKKTIQMTNPISTRKPFPPPPRRHRPAGLDIIYEDQDILVVNKHPGLLTMSDHRDASKTAEHILTQYVKKGNSKSRNRVFVVHRLDRETSGLLAFAKTKPVQEHLKNHWKNTEKIYIAIIYGHLENKTGIIMSYLTEDQNQFVHSVTDSSKGKLTRTAYTAIKETRKFSVVKIKLLTGRKNQIRVHFSEAGHPVVGDVKYGGKPASGKRLALHAKSLSFDHPRTGERMRFDSPIPDFFIKLAGEMDEKEFGHPNIYLTFYE